MSSLRPGDESMHYQDGSHRWTAPDGEAGQKMWEEGIREHQRRHRERLGGPARPARRPAAPPAKLRA